MLPGVSPKFSEVRKEGKIVQGFGLPIRIPGPLDLLSCYGTISKSETNGIVIHVHGILCNDKHEIFGGHLTTGENIVGANMEVVVKEVKGIRVIRRYNPEVGESQLFPEKE